jgi:hypothetical protein
MDEFSMTSWGRRVSVRWVYHHMIEEYARHNGHADFSARTYRRGHEHLTACSDRGPRQASRGAEGRRRGSAQRCAGREYTMSLPNEVITPKGRN